MSDNIVGIVISAPNASAALDQIVKAEELGIKAAWATSGGAGGDALAVFAAAAARTENILLGTSIMQTWSRHPVAAIQQTQAIASLAPGRFRLGIGPSHQAGMERTFGADFRAPLGHLREYISITKSLTQSGSVEFQGRHYTAHASIPEPLDVPIMISALRPRSFEVAGAEADGAISWVCPMNYLRDVALPALRSGAESAGRPTPPLIVHTALCVSEDVDAVRNSIRSQLGYFPTTPFYARMFATAGFPNSEQTGWTDDMLDAVGIWGNEEAVTAKIQEIFSWGASELLATVVPDGSGDASIERTLKLLASV